MTHIQEFIQIRRDVLFVYTYELPPSEICW